MIKVKDGVQFTVFRKDIYRVLEGIDSLFKQYGAICTITCGTDSHGPDDPHTNGYALDFRTHDVLPSQVENLKNEIMGFVGSRYTVLLENPGTGTEHIHVQVRKDLWPVLMKGEGVV